MICKTDAMIKASMIAKAKEEIADFQKSLDAAKQAGVSYAADFFAGLIDDRAAKLEWLRSNLVNPGA